MKVIIAGSRDINDLSTVVFAIKSSGFHITEVVSGGSRGVDKLGEMWAKLNGIPLKVFPADWKKHGKAAGPIRNQEMSIYADALIAIPLPHSTGTKDMIQRAEKRGLKVSVYTPGGVYA